jgi:ABC-type antimicrobial peptide transport system permease subunit
LFFVPWRQEAGIGGVSFYVRTELPPEVIIPQVRNQMRQLDPDLPLENLRTLEEQIRDNIRSDRLVLQLAAVFAFLATLLAMLGLYGVMAYSVTRRSREIGIRLALGASRETVSGMVMREAIVILVIGLLVGIPAALGLARFTESQLFGVKSFDALVVIAAMAALAAATLLAGFFPARKAARVDPVEALRYE